MITRGIVERVVDAYHVKVRIPSIDRVATSSIHTATENLNTAIVATVPGCQIELQPNDVVIVAIDSSEPSAIIIGYLYREESVNKPVTMLLEKLLVSSKAVLPSSTFVGKVTPNELQALQGVQSNIQVQLDELNSRLKKLEEM